jgi:ectoine hydroxylase-related dioxygenase (phytanoyl-CoA dioxygenase family)
LIGGFDPHIDANAYTHVKNIKHLTILAAVDGMNATNGGLEVVDGSHRMDIPLGSDRCIASDWVESNVWTPAELESGMQIEKLTNTFIAVSLMKVGDILIFGSYLAHRSGANASSKDRRAIYATYNCAAEGNLHDQYYSDRQKLWPATHMRQSGQSYEEGRVRYAFGSPMLTVDSKVMSA